MGWIREEIDDILVLGPRYSNNQVLAATVSEAERRIMMSSSSSLIDMINMQSLAVIRLT